MTSMNPGRLLQVQLYALAVQATMNNPDPEAFALAQRAAKECGYPPLELGADVGECMRPVVEEMRTWQT